LTVTCSVETPLPGAVAYAHEAVASLQARVGGLEAERAVAQRDCAAAVAAALPAEQLVLAEREKRCEAERLAARAQMQLAVGDVKVTSPSHRRSQSQSAKS
jgi:hypothetical protein